MEPFFEQSTEQSRVKAAIVAEYFDAWARVMMPVAKRRMGDPRIAYVDLFAGPGHYIDGTRSTPLLVLSQAIGDRDMRNMLVSMFNDSDSNHAERLREAISQLTGVASLRFPPQVMSFAVDNQLPALFENTSFIPTLFFLDPFGYKGLSRRLVSSTLKDWGCECILFFNYNRINMGLTNPSVDEHMDALFGRERADRLRERLPELDSNEREVAILEELAQALLEAGGGYVLPFSFLNEQGKRTSHHLVFVSKHPLGYKIMKEIMAAQSSKTEQGVPSFRYCPADHTYRVLFEYNRPLDDLKPMLLQQFSGQTLTMQQVYERHNIGTPFLEKHYKRVLLELEAEGRITVLNSNPKRRKNTFADGLRIQFPRVNDVGREHDSPS